MSAGWDAAVERIERALAMAGRQRIDVRRLDDGAEYGGYIYRTGGWIVGCDPFDLYPMVIVDDGTVDLDGRFLTPDHERVVALVRAVLAGGWAASIAELGVVPTVDAMLAECARLGWWTMIESSINRVTWFARICPWDGDAFDKAASRNTPAEALAVALVRGVLAGEGAG